jgi:hypothetical protein
VRGRIVVASGESCNNEHNCGLFVRAFDRTSRQIQWQDELLDFVWTRANEVSIDASRAFVAGW